MFRTIADQFEPIDAWPGEPTKNRRRSPFKATLDNTYRLLEHELVELGCRRLVIQANCDRHMIRNDGLLRSDARLRGPGVILAFDSKHGPLRYPCDTFDHWDSNLRAIGLALEALRKVDRYGVTRRAEQYRGWQALPAPDAGETIRTEEDAWKFLENLLGHHVGLKTSGAVEFALREAERKTHPDKGGNADDFKKVQRARELLLGTKG